MPLTARSTRSFRLLTGNEMTIAVDLNADMAEGFGAYNIEDDAGILKVIRAANIAYGFHIDNLTVMHPVVKMTDRAKAQKCTPTQRRRRRVDCHSTASRAGFTFRSVPRCGALPVRRHGPSTTKI
jgi:hypothetical protein